MGILEKFFGKIKEIKETQGYFKLLNGYTPVFRNWNGRLYEADLCRYSIDSIARHCGKLRPVPEGKAKKELLKRLEMQPNSMLTWYRFLYRVSTILNHTNTAFIVPTFGNLGQITGIYPIYPESWELVQVENEPWIRFNMGGGQRMAIELENVGILTRFQLSSDFFGENNEALNDVMNLIKIQRQGIKEYTKNAASYRFMAKVSNFVKAEDLKKERERFNENNFQEEGGGLLLFPSGYSEIKQINQQNYAVDAKQTEIIQNNVFNYFGTNLDVIQNKCFGDAFSAFYEGAIETFSIQLSEAITMMLFTEKERLDGCKVTFTTNRLQFMTNADKLAVSTDMVDRGLMSRNEIREIWNLPPIPGGDKYIIRGEYYSTDEKLGQKGKANE